MKRFVPFLAAVVSAAAVCAQQPAGLRPAAAPRAVPAAGALAATNEANPWLELRDIDARLNPIEFKLMETDPDFKAIIQKQKALRTALQELDKKKQEKLDQKLASDPATAALEARRKELLKRISEMKPAGAPAGAKEAPRPNAAPVRPPVTVVAP